MGRNLHKKWGIAEIFFHKKRKLYSLVWFSLLTFAKRKRFDLAPFKPVFSHFKVALYSQPRLLILH